MASTGPNLTDLKRYLSARSQPELVNEIAELFKKIPAVKEHYQIKLNPHSEDDVLEKYKNIIRNEFFPDRGLGKARLSVARKAVNDFKKVARSPDSVADLMVFYVEQGVAFTEAYGDIDEPFYNSMESMYEKAAQWITQHSLTGGFPQRCHRMVAATAHMGWGFPDTLSDIYQEYFG
jgi:hypothetical protein